LDCNGNKDIKDQANTTLLQGFYIFYIFYTEILPSQFLWLLHVAPPFSNKKHLMLGGTKS